MSYTSSDLTQRALLTSEIQGDPRGYGYAALVASGSDQGLADLLNMPRAITVSRGVRTGIDVMNCIVLAAWEALTVGRQQYLLALVTPVEGVDLSNATVRANLAACFPVGATRTALLAVADKTDATRAEELFGINTRIGANDVAQALGRG